MGCLSFTPKYERTQKSRVTLRGRVERTNKPSLGAVLLVTFWKAKVDSSPYWRVK